MAFISFCQLSYNIFLGLSSFHLNFSSVTLSCPLLSSLNLLHTSSVPFSCPFICRLSIPSSPCYSDLFICSPFFNCLSIHFYIYTIVTVTIPSLAFSFLSHPLFPRFNRLTTHSFISFTFIVFVFQVHLSANHPSAAP